MKAPSGWLGMALVLAILALAAFALGRWSIRPDVVFVTSPPSPLRLQAPAPPATSPAPPRTRLADVRRDWGIEGRLVCESRIP